MGSVRNPSGVGKPQARTTGVTNGELLEISVAHRTRSKYLKYVRVQSISMFHVSRPRTILASQPFSEDRKQGLIEPTISCPHFTTHALRRPSPAPASRPLQESPDRSQRFMSASRLPRAKHIKTGTASTSPTPRGAMEGGLFSMSAYRYSLAFSHAPSLPPT